VIVAVQGVLLLRLLLLRGGEGRGREGRGGEGLPRLEITSGYALVIRLGVLIARAE